MIKPITLENLPEVGLGFSKCGKFYTMFEVVEVDGCNVPDSVDKIGIVISRTKNCKTSHIEIIGIPKLGNKFIAPVHSINSEMLCRISAMDDIFIKAFRAHMKFWC